MKMNKLIGLAFTYVDSASSENEFHTAGRIGRKMIQKELACDPWVASRILGVLGNRESWFPHSINMPDSLPVNASDIFENSLKALNIKYSKVDYGFGGVTFKQI